LVTNCHNILFGWRNYFSQLLNLHGVNDVRLTSIHKTQTLVLELRTFRVETAIGKIKIHKSPGTAQIPGELNKQVLEKFVLRSNLSFHIRNFIS